MDLEAIGIPEHYFGAAVSKIKNLSPEQFANLANWAATEWGNCIFHGEPGRGKTYAAIALMQYFKCARKIPWHEQRFVSVGILNQQWLTNMQDYVLNSTYASKIKEVKVLVIDDLGLRKPSDGFLDYLFDIINHRCLQRDLITIYSTNLQSKELNDILGPRLISRIADGPVFKFEGPDIRRLMPKNSKIEPIQSDKTA
jgi:DNA replication protein DnaC